MTFRVIHLVFGLCFFTFLFNGQALSQDIELVSKSSEGEYAGGFRPHLSGNGRYVVFTSGASNLVEGVDGTHLQIYLHDRKESTTTLISKNAEGEPGNDHSLNPFVSYTGRYIGFGSKATNLDSADDNELEDCFLVDTVLDKIERYSSAIDGVATSSCGDVLDTRPVLSISGDGRYATFPSGDGVKLVDRGQGTVETILEQSFSSPLPRPIVNADGTVVVFASSDELDETVDGSAVSRQVYVYDIATEEISLASKSPEGDYANGNCERHSVSDDGTKIQFDSGASNLVVNDTNGDHDVFVYDRESNVTLRTSLTTDGDEITDGTTGFSWISGNGLFSAYSASGTVSDTVAGAPSQFNIFVYDIEAEETTEFGLNTDGDEANGRAIYPVIDSVGHRVVYNSAASDLISDDANGLTDVFVEKNIHCENSGDENNNGIIDCLDVSRETRPGSGTLANKKKRKALLLMENFEGDVVYKAKANCRFTKNGEVIRPRRRAQSDDTAVLFRRLKGVCKFRYRVVQDGVRSRLSRRLRAVFGRVNR
jgi:hypothetical protein